MKTVVIISLLLNQLCACSQSADFLVLKKNDHAIKMFYSGSNISFTTPTGYYTGNIRSIYKDTVFLTEYDIRQVPTNLGVYTVDTVARYQLAFNYKDILAIGAKEKKGFDWKASGGALFGGGILLTTVGLGTWLFTKPGSQYYAAPYLVAGSAALAGIGYLLLKSNNKGMVISKKYQLAYMQVKK
ncbi:MAG: hypothetical protein H0W12_02180 [Chitinophagaceae bacterium]|nr:hypothetical protein [Chitinophagaceae bacterium]